MKCPTGHDNPADAKFCEKCGERILAPPAPAASDPAPMVAEAPAPQAAAPEPAATQPAEVQQPAAPEPSPQQPTAADEAPSGSRRVLGGIQWLLLLEPRRRGWSYLVVALFYLVVLFGVALVFEGEPESDPDYTSVESDIAFAVAAIVIARVVAGLIISWLEREPASEAT